MNGSHPKRANRRRRRRYYLDDDDDDGGDEKVKIKEAGLTGGVQRCQELIPKCSPISEPATYPFGI